MNWEIKIEKSAPAPTPQAGTRTPRKMESFGGQVGSQGYRRSQNQTPLTDPVGHVVDDHPDDMQMVGKRSQPIRIYPYGVARNRLQQAAKRLGVPVIVVRDIMDAQSSITLRSYYRNRQATIIDAEARGMPIYVLRANTVSQIEQFLADIFNLSEDAIQDQNLDGAIQQAQAAIEAVLNGERYMDLAPAASSVRRMQHELAKKAELISQSYGREPYRRVRIYRE